ncbi:MAG: peptidylprolyl isomerase [Alphaproteobacteria bacterium]|nr:peptidylprolyl isomerase [Alphaproteobacteria bacterium]MBU1516186.1 peptidylprolyl isomerase [Alphaproteobacteria bacterium]MBU2093496.1 peptidylprolyl isomerase [Alphaproteobacteria bacterium]MBU2152344.1 peptidylprolyl isomerase [Alphaproteobacteria bacterium]MBU2308158.1 peptidylprolyl isomerase [Alphaproteobacteria bacterium]
MLRRTLLALSVAALASAAQSQPAASPAPEPATTPPPVAAPPAKPNPKVKLETPQGVIVVELFPDKAPITVANYLKYVDRGLFNGATFYRASRPKGYAGTDYGLIQGGLQNDPKKVLPPIAHESTIKTGLTHKTNGTISMGRHAPGTAQSDWSITLGDMSYLDADPKDPKTNPGFAAFGQVVEGLDVVQKIIALPTDPVRGEGAMKGEMLKAPVKITRASRVVP